MLGPRIYDIEARSAADLDGWRRDLPRIFQMHFDWVRVRCSGSAMPAEGVSDFVAAIRDQGLRAIFDLPADGPSVSPGEGLLLDEHEIGRLIELGVDGFFCTSAHRVSADVWQRFIQSVRDSSPSRIFIGEALGVPAERVEALRDAGFDYLVNSARWWDYRADWLLDQYRRFRFLAPTISFPPEPPAIDPEGTAQRARSSYLFSACFATGIMMPAGYEYGLSRASKPVAANSREIDISAFIGETNALRSELGTLNQEGPQHRITAPGAPVLALLRAPFFGRDSRTLLVVNADERHPHGLEPGLLLTEAGGDGQPLIDTTPMANPLSVEPGHPLVLAPLEVRLFKEEDVIPNGEGREASLPRPGSQTSSRVRIAAVWPEIESGRYPAKRVVGDVLEVWADIYSDGHDQLAARLLHRHVTESAWRDSPMVHFGNDRWVGRFGLARQGSYLFAIEAWRDPFASWRADFEKKRAANTVHERDLAEGEAFVAKALKRAKSGAGRVNAHGPGAASDIAARIAFLLSEETRSLMSGQGPRADLCRYERVAEVFVERTAARYGSWYEMFPRSASDHPGQHGRFADVRRHLPRIAQMGFNVLYFPPIHPIGRTNRKGRNNSLIAAFGDPGSVYAIGSPEGGHAAIHPELGTFAEFDGLVRDAADHGIELALDFAVQCSPDHPWIQEHRKWFAWNPDGSIKFAENPPKKYEDIVNLDFASPDWQGLWSALRDVVESWVGHGVRIFRVDNPHTKPLPFWEWLIRDIRERHPDVIFLAEAFTRPKMMQALAKAGFSQSYTYFTWRNTKAELTEYLLELTGKSKEYFRPNFFVNTPDINPSFLQTGGRPAFMIRAALAATLSGLWGMYSGFELCEAAAIPGREEYLNSEKYELKAWDWDRPGNIVDYVTTLNRLRRDNPALHDFANLKFHLAHDDSVLFYSKVDPTGANRLWIAVALDPAFARDVAIELPLETLGLNEGAIVEAEALFGGGKFTWIGRHQRIHLDPAVNPCEIWRLVDPPLREPEIRGA